MVVTCADRLSRHTPLDKTLREGSCEHEKVGMDPRRTRAQVLVELGELPFSSVPLHGKDAQFQQEVAHKIFVWDSNGVYQDAYYPYPRYGHFLNDHHTLKGAHVRDVFPGIVGCRLQATIKSTWKKKTRKSIQLVFERDRQRFEATVTCVPTQEGRVMGLVTDRLVGPCLVTENSVSLRGSGRLAPQLAQGLTPRQCQVGKAVMAGWSNETIGAHLGITERTVKKHLHHIYLQLGVVNRMALFVYVANAGTCDPSLFFDDRL